ncbi:ABC transporter permease subunit [Thorsellia anophelis]|uniref:Cationic peptide transport system permease protein n=1 Tax=Thorsellia anophelis DSM 18579 TaxID=1123402 RepID=A0A1I0EN38_9GAMM|nr:ABC transporter permease subunit [Thorsellia anophelis]SET46678.1 cationic peptide transport system permease protein [Thorsellia anophelis DSM 18579]
MDSIYHEKITYSRWRNTWHAFQKDLLCKVGAYIVLGLIILTFIGEFIKPYPINEQFLDYTLMPPIWAQSADLRFVLGTDDLGRDILSRIIAGVPATFGSGLLVALIVFLIGISLSLFIALGHHVRALIINHILDILLSIPSLLLAIILIAFMEASLLNASIAVALALLPRLTVTLYGAISDELDKEYVSVLRLDGANLAFIVRKIIIPNISPLLVNEFTRTFSLAILDISALGFLDLGAQLPSSEWGTMIGNSLESIFIAPWTVMLPGLAIFITVLSINLFGFGVSRAIIKGVS